MMDSKCAACEYALKDTTKACSECLGCYGHDKFVKHEIKTVWRREIPLSASERDNPRSN